VFLAKNGVELDPDDDAAFEFVVAVAAGEIDDVGEIATVLASWQLRDGDPSGISAGSRRPSA
jgi:hypothetical protein